MGRIWVIKTAVIFCPSFVPGTCAIRGEIISTWPFAYPKDCRNDTFFPWIPPRRLRGGRFSEGLGFFNDRFGWSSKGRIMCDKERETKKSQVSSVSPLLSNWFPFKDSLEPMSSDFAFDD